jgi:Mor family transcriptional regulator
MTDFVTDLKTRLLEQAAELGITPQTARLLAAAIDATAKDYAGDRVYIGKGDSGQMSARNQAIIRDWRAGERVPLLSRRYGISVRHIRRIVTG